MKLLKYILVALLVAALAALEFVHEFGSEDSPRADARAAPDTIQDTHVSRPPHHLHRH